MLLDLLFPNRCLACSTIIPAEEAVCAGCLPQLSFTHQVFSKDSNLAERCRLLFPTEFAYALLQFQEKGLSRALLHRLKYGDQEQVGRYIADLTSERLSFGQHRPDVMLTVPLHPKKLRTRGYNQLHSFTNQLSATFGIPCDHTALRRNFSAKSQASRGRKERQETTAMFSMERPITGKHILLVDDVFTTGNTLATIAWEVLKNPGNRISVLVMAVDV